MIRSTRKTKEKRGGIDSRSLWNRGRRCVNADRVGDAGDAAGQNAVDQVDDAVGGAQVGAHQTRLVDARHILCAFVASTKHGDRWAAGKGNTTQQQQQQQKQMRSDLGMASNWPGMPNDEKYSETKR